MNFKTILVYLVLMVYFIIFLVTGAIPGGKVSRAILYRNQNPAGYWTIMTLFAIGIVFFAAIDNSKSFQDFFYNRLLKNLKTKNHQSKPSRNFSVVMDVLLFVFLAILALCLWDNYNRHLPLFTL